MTGIRSRYNSQDMAGVWHDCMTSKSQKGFFFPPNELLHSAVLCPIEGDLFLTVKTAF